MQPIHFLPPAVLAPYISFYGIWDMPEGFSDPYVSPPLGLCGCMLTLEGKSNARVNGKLFMEHSFCVTGQVTGPVSGSITGKMKQLLVFVLPCGLYQLFGIDMSKLTNTSMPLAELVGQDEEEALIRRLKAAASNEEMIAITNGFFIAQQPIFEIAPKIKHAIDYIHRKKGNVSVKDIERNCYITPRSLERHFNLYIGLSPSEYIKIFRFKCLMNYIRENPGITWDKLSEQNGYYDQSHITRYFARYLNIKPNELVTLDTEFINYLLQD